MLLNYFSTLKLIWDLWYDCRFIVMVLCPSDISIWVNTGHRTTQHLSNFHPSPALLQPGDTLSRLICLSATEIVVDIRDLLVTVTWVWPVSVCNVEHVTVVTRHTTHQDLVTVVTAPVTRWLHISIHCLPVLCCKHAHTALHVLEN